MILTHSATHCGPQGVVLEIEASLQKSLPGIVITGLPGDVVKESRERIRACLSALGYDVPSSRAVIHLSPATEKKQGSQLDLGVAISLLAEEGVLNSRRRLAACGFLGELSLDGRIRGVRGALALAEALVQSSKVETLVVSAENAVEVGLLLSPKIQVASSLMDVVRLLESEGPAAESPATPFSPRPIPSDALDGVEGQPLAKRALQIALAGRHHLLMIGPPGVGKSLMAKAARFLLPPLEKSELIQLIKHQGYFDAAQADLGLRPFRSPHHSISPAGLIGGGNATVNCGEVTLAHGGILFLDELPEFRKDVLEGLREPMQNGEIHLNRVGARLTLPARFLLIAAMNPCPCGYSLDTRKQCICPPGKPEAYRRKISGPLYDRIDLAVVLSRPQGVTANDRFALKDFLPPIEAAYRWQAARWGRAGRFNSDAEVDPKQGPFAVGSDGSRWLDGLCARESVSFRSLHKTLRVARTIADLEGEEQIAMPHLLEAWGLRCRDLSAAS